MKNILACIFCLCITLVHTAKAGPFALQDPQKNKVSTLSVQILNQKKISFYVNDPAMEQQVIDAFTGWFNNVLNRLSNHPQQNTEIKPLLAALKHGADPATYQRLTEIGRANIHIFYLNTLPEMKYYCGGNASGCAVTNKLIYLYYPGSGNVDNHVLTHEIGHLFGLKDLYDSQFSPEAMAYGSGKEPSVMNRSHYLTCDDADAIVNSLFLASQKTDTPLTHFPYTSFCDPNRKFLNARLTNRRPIYTDFNGVRTIYTFCQNGTPHSIVQITPSNPQHLYRVLQAPANCPFVNEEGQTAHTLSLPSSWQDIPVKGSAQNSATIQGQQWQYTLPAPTGSMRVNIVLNQPHLPGYVYIEDTNGTPAYLFAYLENGYNLVYDFHINTTPKIWQAEQGRLVAKSTGSMFIYNRQHPHEYAFLGGPCQSALSGCPQMYAQMQRQLLYFSALYSFLPPMNIAQPSLPINNYLKNAKQWEEFLLSHYPPVIAVREHLSRLLSQRALPTQKAPRLPIQKARL